MHEGRARHDAPFQIQYLNLFLIACCKRMCEGSLLLVYCRGGGGGGGGGGGRFIQEEEEEGEAHARMSAELTHIVSC